MWRNVAECSARVLGWTIRSLSVGTKSSANEKIHFYRAARISLEAPWRLNLNWFIWALSENCDSAAVSGRRMAIWTVWTSDSEGASSFLLCAKLANTQGARYFWWLRKLIIAIQLESADHFNWPTNSARPTGKTRRWILGNDEFRFGAALFSTPCAFRRRSL